MGRVAELGCIVCRLYRNEYTPAVIHHIREGQGMSERASHYLTIPLCPPHHKDHGSGVSFHDDERTFKNLFGSEIELLAATISLFEKVYVK